MTRTITRAACLASCLGLLTPIVVSAQQQPAHKRVLLLHESALGQPMAARFGAAFDQAIRSGGPVRMELYDETIGTARFPGADANLVKDYLRRKYTHLPMDVIVAQGILPLNFAEENRALFGSPPIVAVAAPAGRVADRTDGVTGLQGGDFISGTIDLALTLRPETRTVIVIDGMRPRVGAGEVRREFERQVRERRHRIETVYLNDLPLTDVVAQVAQSPPDSIVFFLRQTMRNADEDLNQFEALDEIVRVSPVPVFSQTEDFVGHGILGGHVWNYEADAWRLAEMARQIAAGKNARDVPAERATYRNVLDWQQIQRWQISEARVPQESIVLFRPHVFYDTYRRYVVGGVLVFAAQLVLIAGLLVQRVRRRDAEENSRQIEARNSAMLRAIPDLMFVMRRDGTYVDYHARDVRLLFAAPHVFLGKKLSDVMPTALVPLFMDAIERAFMTDEPVVVEYELPLPETRHFEARLVKAGEDRMLTMVRDVTVSKVALERNHELAGRLIASQESERQRIARELHDDFSQELALLNIEIDQIARQAGSGSLRLQLQHASRQAGLIARRVHDLSRDLHPSKLQTLGLPAAVQALCRDMARSTGVAIEFSDEMPSFSAIDPELSLCLYRIVQEALNNIAKHSRAREASVRLASEHDEARLYISDSGIGFDEQAIGREGLGLVSMRERVAYLNGEIMIRTYPGGGTRIGVRIPLTRESQEPVASGHSAHKDLPAAAIAAN